MIKKERLRLFGGEIETIVDETESGGKFDLFKNIFAPSTEVPLHMHTRYSETIYLTSGKMTVFLKERTIVLEAGDHFVIPVNTPHAVLNSEGKAEAIVVASPSGFARLVKTAGVPPESGKEVNMELFKKMCDELGDVLLGPPGSRP